MLTTAAALDKKGFNSVPICDENFCRCLEALSVAGSQFTGEHLMRVVDAREGKCCFTDGVGEKNHPETRLVF